MPCATGTVKFGRFSSFQSDPTGLSASPSRRDLSLRFPFSARLHPALRFRSDELRSLFLHPFLAIRAHPVGRGNVKVLPEIFLDFHPLPFVSHFSTPGAQFEKISEIVHSLDQRLG